MPLKILVVDDEVLLERLIKQQFKKEIRANQYEFIFAHNGREALDVLAEDGQINIILTDLNMPQMDGLTFLGLLKEKNINIKTIVISAYGDTVNVTKAMAQGACDFFIKPIDFDKLRKTIQVQYLELESS